MTQESTLHTLKPPDTPSTRAAQSLCAPPIPHKALKLSGIGNECKPLGEGSRSTDADEDGVPGCIGARYKDGPDGGLGVDAAAAGTAVGPPYRRAIPDQGRTVLRQGLTLVHSSAQHKRPLCDRGDS